MQSLCLQTIHLKSRLSLPCRNKWTSSSLRKPQTAPVCCFLPEDYFFSCPGRSLLLIPSRHELPGKPWPDSDQQQAMHHPAKLRGWMDCFFPLFLGSMGNTQSYKHTGSKPVVGNHRLVNNHFHQSLFGQRCSCLSASWLIAAQPPASKTGSSRHGVMVSPQAPWSWRWYALTPVPQQGYCSAPERSHQMPPCPVDIV